jgi:hypothetical protein
MSSQEWHIKELVDNKSLAEISGTIYLFSLLEKKHSYVQSKMRVLWAIDKLFRGMFTKYPRFIPYNGS